MNNYEKLWTEQNILWLKENYPKFGSEYCSKYLNRGRHAIINKAYKLKIKFTRYKATKIGYKICCKCLVEKPLSEFSAYLKKVKLKTVYDGACRICNNKKRKERRKTNPEIYNSYIRQYNKRKRLTDPNVKLRSNLRSRLYSLLKYAGVRKHKSTFELIGCHVTDVKKYLESQFKIGMTWDNYGRVWHIDHIIPCYTFDLTLPDQQEKCFHYTNLRPLWVTTEIARQFGDMISVGNLNR